MTKRGKVCSQAFPSCLEPSKVPLGRVAEPEEIAKLIEFCALDAPPSMTGATLDANGASYVR